MLLSIAWDVSGKIDYPFPSWSLGTRKTHCVMCG